jgi:cyclic beta-1,2-glucan synthetase
MAALEEHLWRKEDGLQLLLDPPFSTANPSPGYIMGYLPGIRENGGQYNHAAAWSAAAFAGLGDGAKAHALFSMLNPARVAGTRAGMQRYRLEPYVMAGDVYSRAPHMGRGGWSWYTGSAAWMYRVAVESILGLELRGAAVILDPCIPPSWPGFEMSLAWGGATLLIRVLNPRNVSRGLGALHLDGAPATPLADGSVAVPKDGRLHRLDLVLGSDQE